MPVAPVRLSLSDPAKSTKWNFAVSDSMSSGFAGAFMVQIWEIFHVHLSMYFSYRGSSLSTNFGILKKSYYAKFVLVSTT